MVRLLLHNPWVHIYLVYVGGLAIVFLCSLRRPHRTGSGATRGKALTEVRDLRGRRRHSNPSVGRTRALFPALHCRARPVDWSRNDDQPPFFPCI
jgi:hypothetical protein